MKFHTILTLIVTINFMRTSGNAETNIQSKEQETDSRVLPESILTIDTNMSQRMQQDARQLLMTIYDQHIDQNRCRQFAQGFYERYRTLRWVCFKFVADPAGGNYYINSDTYFIELAVTDAVDGSVTNYLLFSVKRFF